jgi:hypothetical protein
LFCKTVNNVTMSKAAYLNYLVQRDELYWAFPFTKDSLISQCVSISNLVQLFGVNSLYILQARSFQITEKKNCSKEYEILTDWQNCCLKIIKGDTEMVSQFIIQLSQLTATMQGCISITTR